MLSFDEGILSFRPLLFPVRHHSPASARALRAVAQELRPAVILIEGPSDFNDRIDEMMLDHELPIAIYSYVRRTDGARRGAFYPFCVHSPEWQALQVARELGVDVRFIDLPWTALADSEEAAHRYGDQELRRGEAVDRLCRRLGVEDFDALWDVVVEMEADLAPATYLERCHRLCFAIRAGDGAITARDVRRETFMAAQVHRASCEIGGPLLVVTGGAHSYGIYQRLKPGAGSQHGGWSIGREDAAEREVGIALTPYSYQRLDSLAGYEAGMPSPGFYHQVWQDRREGRSGTYRRVLARTAQALRTRGQPVSAADLIAVETTCRGLAALRGHPEVWRTDLIDGIIGALVKDEIAYGQPHPFLAAVQDALRGDARGRLASGATLPPLVHDVTSRLRAHDLELEDEARRVELDLFESDDRTRSRLLHSLRVLGIAGFRRVAGTDMLARDDLVRVWEHWELGWTPAHEADLIEAAIYGADLRSAVAARLIERSGGGRPGDSEAQNAETAASVLLDGALAGLDLGAQEKAQERLSSLLGRESDLAALGLALGHLLYLYRYDEVLGMTGGQALGLLLVEAYGRGLFLLDGIGRGSGREDELLASVRMLVETLERCGEELGLDRQLTSEVLTRVGDDASQTPLLRGAAIGALWTMGLGGTAGNLRAAVQRFSSPDHLGDFLTGLFGLAREAIEREPAPLMAVDEVVSEFDDDAFLAALPALRLAFSRFTPREKDHLARTLGEARGLGGASAPVDLVVSAELAAEALALESRVIATMARHGLGPLGADDGD
jgi:hypothetical protein